MNVAGVSTTPAQTANTAARLQGGPSTTSFDDMLKALREPASVIAPVTVAAQSASSPSLGSITVRRGDCLSRICAAQLKEQGSPLSSRNIRAAVLEVARANHIADPDKIYIGQKLGMPALTASASGHENPDVLTAHASAKQCQSLVKEAVALSSGFGLRKDPFTGLVHQHDGIDVSAPAGAPIQAFAAGSVIFSGWKQGYGNTVIVRHEDGMESVYGHISTLLVQVGDQVTSRMPIGSVGSTGRSTGAHLHFEVRRNGKAVNPIPLLEGKSLQAAQMDT